MPLTPLEKELLEALRGLAFWLDKWSDQLTIEEQWTDGWRELSPIEEAAKSAIARAECRQQGNVVE